MHLHHSTPHLLCHRVIINLTVHVGIFALVNLIVHGGILALVNLIFHVGIFALVKLVTLLGTASPGNEAACPARPRASCFHSST